MNKITLLKVVQTAKENKFFYWAMEKINKNNHKEKKIFTQISIQIDFE